MIQETPCVSIITPISGVGIDLSNLRLWLGKTRNLPIKTILIHDEVDQVVRNNLEQMVKELSNPHIMLLHGQFGSPGAARNKGIEFLDTERVVFWDSDDIGEPYSLIQTIHTHKDSRVIVGSFTMNSDSNLFSNYAKILRLDQTLEIQLGMSPGIWRYIFDRSVIDNTRFSTSRMGEDQQFLIEIQVVPEMITITESIIYNYFVGSPNHLTSQQSAKLEVIRTFSAIQKLFIERSQKLNLFETTVYLKVFWSTMKFSSRSKHFLTLISFLQLVFISQKIVFSNLVQIARFVKHKKEISC